MIDIHIYDNRTTVSLNRLDLAAWAISSAIGSLLARTVCQLSWKEASLWSVPFFYVLTTIFRDFNIEQTNGDLTLQGRVKKTACLLAGLGIVALVSYTSNQAASYLMKVPSALFVMSACPLIHIGSGVFAQILQVNHII